ncbi:MAG TPA: hypothetical protein VFT45_02015 [Longimicrobium sp.]|nr:hypothetical protein [Longimicrobium sp.]
MMEYSTASEYDPWLDALSRLLGLLLLFAVPVVAVLVARYRPSWLFRAWIAMWLLLAAGMSAANPAGLRDGGMLLYVLLVGGPSGLTVLWLHRTRRHRVLSRLAAQFASAVLVQVCATVLLVIGLDSLPYDGGY